MRENADQNNSQYGHLLRSEFILYKTNNHKPIEQWIAHRSMNSKDPMENKLRIKFQSTKVRNLFPKYWKSVPMKKTKQIWIFVEIGVVL